MSREVMVRAKRLDLRAVWEATAFSWSLRAHQGPLPEEGEDWQDWWMRFTRPSSSHDYIFFGGMKSYADWRKIEKILEDFGTQK